MSSPVEDCEGHLNDLRGVVQTEMANPSKRGALGDEQQGAQDEVAAQRDHGEFGARGPGHRLQ